MKLTDHPLPTGEETPQGSSANARMPGPGRSTAFRNTIAFARDAIGTAQAMRMQYGDVVTVPTLLGPWVLVFHPDGVRHVLQENHLNYDKDVADYHVLGRLLGKGLLTNDGESWLQQRRLIQPAFHRARVAAFGTLMAEAAQRWTEQWEERLLVDSARSVDILHEMSGLALTIVSKALFGATMSDDTPGRVSRALTSVNHALTAAFYLPGILSLPTRQRRAFRAARAELHAVVDEMVAQRRASGVSGDDLLAMLLEARDAETHAGMTNEQLRDEVLTLLLAGHETTANVLTWAFYLLARHPQVATGLRTEYWQHLYGKPPKLEDLDRLPLTRMVVDETMRLYPPAWAVGRHAKRSDKIGEYAIPEGASVYLFPAVTHRHPDYWEEPDAFVPQRFTEERQATKPKFAFFPFGGGPRLCIGYQFALYEAQLILATIMQRYELRLLPERTVVPEALVTLRPKGGLPMTIHRAERV